MNVQTLLDSQLFPADRRAIRHLVLRLGACPAPNTPPPPLDLALVVDRSGSMSGRPLQHAREAACLVARELRPEDRLAVVDFGSAPYLTLPPRRMTPATLKHTERCIRGIQCEGCTDLHGGWRLGVDALAYVHDAEEPRSRRVVVLSDGMGNLGVTEPEELAVEAEDVLDRGVVTSAVGFGVDYSTEQLEALALHGGGRLYHASRPGRIAALLREELRASTVTVAENLVVELRLPPGLSATCLSACPERGMQRWSLGSLVQGATRDVVFRLEGRPKSGDLRPRLRWVLRYRKPGEWGSESYDAGSAAFELTEGENPRIDALDPEVVRLVARAERAGGVREALGHYERGNRRRGLEVLEQRANRLRDWAGDDPAVQAECRMVDACLRQMARQSLEPLVVKEMMTCSVNEQRGETPTDRSDAEEAAS